MSVAGKTRNDESGLVSIVIVTTIAIILSLMTIGFTRIMDRELREAIDLELATQAHYAAEAGVNDALLYVANNPTVSESTDCVNLGTPTPPPEFVPSISGDHNGDTTDNTVKYTCVLVDPDPNTVEFDNLALGSSEVFKVSPSSPSTSVGRIYFSWHNSSDDAPVDPTQYAADVSNHPLPQSPAVSADSMVGLLRVTIYRVPGGPIDNDVLQANARTYFMYPNRGSGGMGQILGWGNNGEFVNGECYLDNQSGIFLPYSGGGGRLCNTAINVNPAETFYVRLSAVYKNLSVSVQATNSSGNSLELAGAQASIDSTGQGNDVLKRIAVRAPLGGGDFPLPEYAIKSMQTLCKRLRIPYTGPNSFGDAVNNDINATIGLDDVCLPAR